MYRNLSLEVMVVLEVEAVLVMEVGVATGLVVVAGHLDVAEMVDAEEAVAEIVEAAAGEVVDLAGLAWHSLVQERRQLLVMIKCDGYL